MVVIEGNGKGGNKLKRPLQIGGMLARFLGKLFFQSICRMCVISSGRFSLLLLRNSNGRDKVVHLLNHFLSAYEDAAILGLASANAFGEIKRSSARTAILKYYFPGSVYYFDLRYGAATEVCCGHFRFTVYEGARQGDP